MGNVALLVEAAKVAIEIRQARTAGKLGFRGSTGTSLMPQFTQRIPTAA
jgi:hypothetical protein